MKYLTVLIILTGCSVDNLKFDPATAILKKTIQHSFKKWFIENHKEEFLKI